MKPRERRSHPGEGREKSEYDQKVLDLRRTARVVAGGRRFSFRATLVVGNRNGKVGVGLGKGPDVASSVEKAVFQAKKNIIVVPLNDKKTIPHEVTAKYKAAKIILKPAREGKGLVAGGPIRVIADMAGVKNLTAKILGRTTNKVNNARAVIEALRKLAPKA
ncbi:MAG: 30S ribosomal protein S5 [Candidatus Sungbacteria bacterium]|nr:30S ribosomal protein S5 [bacterium]MDZ4260440.1 30S ribosomal protein S5 [Candidatus Sungbacteria bacterium]